MSSPFIVHDDLIQIDKSNVFIYKKVLQNEEMEIIKKVIDEHTPFSEEYITSDEGNCNVKSKFTTFDLISQQNSILSYIGGLGIGVTSKDPQLLNRMKKGLVGPKK